MAEEANNAPLVIHPSHPPPESHPAKQIEMQLVWYGASSTFQIATIKNSTHFQPGQWLTVATAKQCCDLPNWQVTMADNHVLSSIFGFAVNKLIP